MGGRVYPAPNWLFKSPSAAGVITEGATGRGVALEPGCREQGSPVTDQPFSLRMEGGIMGLFTLTFDALGVRANDGVKTVRDRERG